MGQATCSRCGNSFLRTRDTGSRQLYCSKECRYGPRVSLVCDTCGLSFTRQASRVNRTDRKSSAGNFCSKKCQFSFVRHTPVERVPVPCAACGKVLLLTRVEHLRRINKTIGGAVYCSRKCQAAGSSLRVPMVSLSCVVCGKEFSRRASKQRELKKNNPRDCCGISCSMKLRQEDRKEYDPFRTVLSSLLAKFSKQSGNAVALSLVDLKEQWDSQGGRCPYTGIELILRPARKRGGKDPYQASVDRIDSSLGYTPGNIEFVALWVNYAKNSWSREETMSFLNRYAEYSLARR